MNKPQPFIIETSMTKPTTVLVTGAAGFIGFHLSKKLADNDIAVVGVDNIDPYYDVRLKQARLGRLTENPTFTFHKADIADAQALDKVFQDHTPTHVVNLAAQAGVRYSISNPGAYLHSNYIGFFNVLECCRKHPVEHLVYASSSSVYGLNTKMPFSVHDNVDHPISLYAASKKSNELTAHSYSYLFNLPTTGLRFFTVYGPWGRPDMAMFLFTKAILEGRPIDVFNNGDMQRDFTYIDDIIEGVFRLIPLAPEPNVDWNGEAPDPGSSPAPYRIFNIGHQSPVNLMDFIRLIEKALGKKARLNYLPMQAGDVPATFANVDDLVETTGYKPSIPLEIGVPRFVEWYKSYYRIHV